MERGKAIVVRVCAWGLALSAVLTAGFAVGGAQAQTEAGTSERDGAATSARDEAAAYELYQSAKVKFRAKDYAGAVKDLEAARRLDPDSPNLVFNLARATELMGDKARALASYREYEAMVDEGSVEQKEAQTIIARLEGEGAGEPQEVPEEPLVDAEPEDDTTDDSDTASAGDGNWVPPVLLGTAGVLAAGGVVFGVLALGQKSAAEDAKTEAAYDDASSKRTTFAVISDICVVGALAAGVTGLVLWLADDGSSEDDSDDRAASVRPGATPWLSASANAVTAGVGGHW